MADAYDSMTSSRAYRGALPIEYALNELRVSAGTQFCPVAVEAFISGLNSLNNDLQSDEPQTEQS